MTYALPLIAILCVIYGVIKKVKVYDCFVDGAKTSVQLTLSVFPYLFAMFMLVGLMRQSGFSTWLSTFLAPAFRLVGIPKELIELVLLRPFSGSGSLALLTQIYQQYGVDSYLSRCASVMMGSSETVFYVSSVYFASTKVKNTGWAVPIALFCTLIGCILSCFLCRLM